MMDAQLSVYIFNLIIKGQTRDRGVKIKLQLNSLFKVDRAVTNWPVAGWCQVGPTPFALKKISQNILFYKSCDDLSVVFRYFSW